MRKRKKLIYGKTRWNIIAKYQRAINRYMAEIYSETLTESDINRFWYEFAQERTPAELLEKVKKRRAEMNKRYDKLIRKIEKLKIKEAK